MSTHELRPVNTAIKITNFFAGTDRRREEMLAQPACPACATVSCDSCGSCDCSGDISDKDYTKDPTGSFNSVRQDLETAKNESFSAG
jgi:hypothetical protein